MVNSYNPLACQSTSCDHVMVAYKMRNCELDKRWSAK